MGKTRAKSRRTGNELFKEFLEKNGLLQLEASKLLKVAPSVICGWCNRTVPRLGYRKRIAKWSRGEIPVSCWSDAVEIDQIGEGEVVPLPKASGAR
jgi:hypothetical protein